MQVTCCQHPLSRSSALLKGGASVLSGRRAVSWPVWISRNRPEGWRRWGRLLVSPHNQAAMSQKNDSKDHWLLFQLFVGCPTALKSHDPLLKRHYHHTGVTINDSDPTLLKLDLLHKYEYDSPHFDCLTRKHLDLLYNLSHLFITLHMCTCFYSSIIVHQMGVNGVIMFVKLGLHKSLSLCQQWAQVW